MATLVAKTAVNMNNLPELGLLSNLSQLKTPSITDVSSFKATKGNVSMLLTGHNMTAVLKVPKEGTLDGVNVSVNGQLQYAVNNLGMAFNKMQKNFSGSFQSKIFVNADVITGSDGGDTLLGYNGGDDISGKGGNDNIRGGAGADDINGGAANDTIFGDGGNDVLDGGNGVDTLRPAEAARTPSISTISSTARTSIPSPTSPSAPTCSSSTTLRFPASAGAAICPTRSSSCPPPIAARTTWSSISSRPASSPTRSTAAVWATRSSSPR